MFQKITACLILLAGTVCLSSQSSTGTIVHDGITRDYIIHLPTGYDENQSYPFVYNLHGFTSNAVQQQIYSGMNATADENGFIVCYPNGVATSWNVGWLFGSTADDVGFLVSLVDSLSEEYNIDSDRLYSCGMSNGGFMSYKLACEASDKFAAIASVTGSIVPSELEDCNPVRRMPIMQIHGTADPTVAYNGSFIGAPIEDVVDFWATSNNCNLSPDTIQIENINISDQCTAERIVYSECDNENEVVFYKIEGGEHTWPDATLTIGITNRDFNANQEIWNFFSRFDLNGSVVLSNEEVIPANETLIYPNPVSEILTLSNLSSSIQSVSIINAYGETVFVQSESTSPKMDIEVDHMTNGLYFLILEEGNSKKVMKFVKL